MRTGGPPGMRSGATALAAAAAWLLLAGLSTPAIAGGIPIVYQVNRVIGAGSVTGFIETDGTQGLLTNANILDWILTLDDGLTSRTTLGAGSGGSGFAFLIDGLIATPTDLLFDFDAPGNVIILDSQDVTILWCLDGTAVFCNGAGLETVLVTTIQQVQRSGLQSIANISGGLAVTIDVRPNGPNNMVNVNEAGKIPVAIYGSDDFDIVADGYAALGFGPSQGPVFDWAGSVVSDLNRDGIDDLTLYFRIEESGLDLGDTQGCVVGTTNLGQFFSGCDSINTIACGLGFELALLLPPLVWLRKRRTRRS